MTRTKNKARFMAFDIAVWHMLGGIFLLKIREIFGIDEKRTLRTTAICLPRFCAE